MSFHRVEDGPWPVGTTVAAYLTSSLVGGRPSGPAVSTAVASANGVVEFGGLTEGVSYTAFGHGGSQQFVATNQESRLGALEAAVLPPEKLTTASRLGGMQPAGTLATTIVDRTDVVGTFTPTSGTLRLAAGSDIGTYIPAGTVITNLNVLVNGASGGATLTNSWMCIVRASTLAVQATTVNRGATALVTTGAATVYPIATTLGGSTAGAWTCPVSDVYYIGFCVTGTTMPVLQGNTMATAAAIAPAVTGNSTAGLSTPATLPATVGALSGGGPAFWAWAT